MVSRDGGGAGLAAGAGFAAGAVVLAGATAFGFRILAGALVCWGAEPGGFDAAFLFGAAFFADFVFADFLTDFLPDFFTAGFLAAFFDFLVVFLLVFLLVFLAAFLAVFFAAAVLFFARFFGAALAARGDTFFAFFFLEGFFLAATTHSFKCSNRLVGLISGGAPTASLPRASRIPRKPVVFVPDCTIRCRARRGRSFPIPPPAVQGAADSHSRRPLSVFPRRGGGVLR